MIGSTGVLILGTEYQGLGLLRQLCQSRIRCALLDQDAWGVARFSRFRCRFHHSPRYASDEFWPWLVQLAHDYGYKGWIPIATDDEQVRQFAEHYAEAQALFRLAGLPWRVYRRLYDKRLSYPWAQSLGVYIPRTYIPTQRHDMPGDDWQFPLLVKPAIKREYGRYTRKKAIVAASPAHLTSILNAVLRSVPIDHLLYQEIIPGDGSNQWSYAGFFVQGEPVAAYTACRRRQHPPDYGRASTCVIAIHDPEVEEQSRKLLAALSYTGLAEVEWKRDPRDGRLKFLEINARCWGWHSLSSRVVGNLPVMLYEYLVDHTLHPSAPRYGSRWVKWITDIPVALVLLRQHEISWRDYWASVHGDVVHCDWDAQDPWPFVLQFALTPYLLAKRGY